MPITTGVPTGTAVAGCSVTIVRCCTVAKSGGTGRMVGVAVTYCGADATVAITVVTTGAVCIVGTAVVITGVCVTTVCIAGVAARKRLKYI